MIGEMVAQFVGEILCYGTGRAIVQVFTPHIRISTTSATPWFPESRRRWFALTYMKDGSRYYHESTITFIGMLFWIFVIAAVLIGIHAYRSQPYHAL